MSSFELLSRPGELLFDHSKKVADLALNSFRCLKLNLTEILPQSVWEKLVYITSYSHDFGKATSFFQQYINADDEEKKKLKNHPETHHGLLSAIYTYWLIKDYFLKNSIKSDNKLNQFLPFFCFLIVKKHHGNLKNPIDDELFSEQYNYIKEQLQEINKDEIDRYFKFLSEKIGVQFNLDDFPYDIDSFIKNEFKNRLSNSSIRKQFPEHYPKEINNYLIFQLLYSILIYSDKKSVILREDFYGRQTVNTDAVINYKQQKFGTPEKEIDFIRESIFQEAHQTINHTDLNNRFFSLNVPTGTGKTLCSLSVALQLRKRLKHERGISPRIVYALPFTSIIDQNFAIFNEVLNQPYSNVLLKHHSLADIFYKFDGDDEDKENIKDLQTITKEKFLIESWESEIIVTTFVQLFHTLLTNRNRSLIKFHKLSNSIIMLDEVQSIPIKYWLLMRNLFSSMATIFNCYFILITATQPRIFETQFTKELAPNKKEYFEKLNRVNLEFNDEEMNINQFNQVLLKECSNSKESFLIVLNTINSATQVFNFLYQNKTKAELYFLSTRIIPKERLRRINKIKTSTKRKIIVSTQLIEAGVDIDIENVWRDFGPLDSINQVCGRCNRNSEKTLGKVKIFRLLDDNNRNYYSYIYGKDILTVFQTQDIFLKHKSFNENEFLRNIEQYYEEIEKRMSNEESQRIIDEVKSIRFDRVGEFKLIEDSQNRDDVYIELDDNAKILWTQFKRIKDIDNPLDQKNEFSRIKSQFLQYVISVPESHLKDNCPPKFHNFYYIPHTQLEEYYDLETGFRIEGVTAIW